MVDANYQYYQITCNLKFTPRLSTEDGGTFKPEVDPASVPHPPGPRSICNYRGPQQRMHALDKQGGALHVAQVDMGNHLKPKWLMVSEPIISKPENARIGKKRSRQKYMLEMVVYVSIW